MRVSSAKAIVSERAVRPARQGVSRAVSQRRGAQESRAILRARPSRRCAAGGSSSCAATSAPEPAPSPGPGWVDAPTCHSPSTGVAVPRPARERPPEEVLVEARARRRTGRRGRGSGSPPGGRRERGTTRFRIDDSRFGDVPRDPRLDPVGVALAQLLRPRPVAGVDLARGIALHVPRELLELDPQDAPARRAPALGSIESGCPTTTVASAGSSPRSASFTARETPSSPGVRWTIAVSPEPLVAVPPRRLREREVDLHLGAAVAEAPRLLRRLASARRRAAARRAGSA